MKRHFATLAGLACFAAQHAWAGPLNKAWVAKDAQWVAHVDVEAGMGSTLGRYIISHREDLDLHGLDEVKVEIGIDPLMDIKSLTLYGGAADGSDGIAVIHTTEAVEDMVKRLREKEKSLTTMTVQGMTLYTWNDDGMTRYAQIRSGPKQSDRIVIAAADKDRILSGIAVLDGKAATLTGRSEGPVSRVPKEGSFLFAAMSELPKREAAPFKNAESFVLDIGEADKQIYADLLVNAKTSQDAANMVQIMQGGLALFRMTASNDGEHPELRELSGLADGLTFQADESRITAKFTYSAEKLSACLTGLNEFRKRIEQRASDSEGGRKGKSQKGHGGNKD